MTVQPIAGGLRVEAASEADTERLGQSLARVVEPNVVIGLIGPLGAGKTRLVRALAEGLGADPGAIASPTFVLIHEYDGWLPIYHFDTYRLPSAAAFAGLGPEDYWSAGGVCLVEWADRVEEFLPTDRWTIRIEPTGPDSRRFALVCPEPTAERLRELLAGDQGSVE